MPRRKCEHVYTNRDANVAPQTRSDKTGFSITRGLHAV
jgi:hypothetical protein